MVNSSKRSIKVVMIAQDYLPLLGGAERQIAALAPLLKERGVDIGVVTRRYPGLPAFELMDGVPVYRVPILKTKALASIAFTVTGVPLIGRLRPHVIHAHGLLSPTTIAVTSKYLWGIPVVSKSLRGGTLGDVDRLLKRPLGHSRFHFVQKYVDSFIAISREIENEFANSGIPPEQCRFIPNGVRLDRFQPVVPSQKIVLRKNLDIPDGLIAIFAGRLEKEKRVADLIRVWKRVIQRQPEAHLLIVGTGSQEGLLREMAGANILFRGAVDDVTPYLQASDLFILPSVAEGLSNALLEALATGLPVVVTATGGTTDIVRHKVSGWLIEHYEPDTLLEGILAMLEDPSLRKNCAEEGRRFVMEKYSIINTANHLCNLYNRLISREPPAKSS